MADNRNIYTDNVIFLKDTASKLADVSKSYSEFQRSVSNPNVWIGNINIKSERDSAEKLRYDIGTIIRTGVCTEIDLMNIKSKTTSIVANLVKILAVAKKNDDTNTSMSEFFRARNSELEKLISDFKSILSKSKGKRGSGNSERPQYGKYEKLMFNAANISGMTPVATMLKSVFDIGHNIRSTIDDFKSAKDGKAPTSGTTSSYTPSVLPTTIDDRANRAETKTEVFKRKGKYYEAERSTTGQIKSMSEIDPVHASLIKFFNTSAYKAKWTKALLEAVEGIRLIDPSDNKGDKKENIIEKALNKIPSMLLSAIPAALSGTIFTALAYVAGKREQKDVERFLGGKENFQKIIDPKGFFGKAKEHIYDWGTGIIGGVTGIGSSFNKIGTDAGLKASGSKMELESAPSAQGLEMVGVMNLLSRFGNFITRKRTQPSDASTAASAKVTPTIPAIPSGVVIPVSDGTGSTDNKQNVAKLGTNPVTVIQPEHTIERVDVNKLQSKSLKEIPIDTAQSNLQKEVKGMVEKLKSAITDMNQTLIDGSKNTSSKRPSGYDANNTRNPVLSSLGAGQLDISNG